MTSHSIETLISTIDSTENTAGTNVVNPPILLKLNEADGISKQIGSHLGTNSAVIESPMVVNGLQATIGSLIGPQFTTRNDAEAEGVDEDDYDANLYDESSSESSESSSDEEQEVKEDEKDDSSSSDEDNDDSSSSDEDKEEDEEVEEKEQNDDSESSDSSDEEEKGDDVSSSSSSDSSDTSDDDTDNPNDSDASESSDEDVDSGDESGGEQKFTQSQIGDSIRDRAKTRWEEFKKKVNDYKDTTVEKYRAWRARHKSRPDRVQTNLNSGSNTVENAPIGTNGSDEFEVWSTSPVTRAMKLYDALYTNFGQYATPMMDRLNEDTGIKALPESIYEGFMKNKGVFDSKKGKLYLFKYLSQLSNDMNVLTKMMKSALEMDLNSDKTKKTLVILSTSAYWIGDEIIRAIGRFPAKNPLATK